MRYVVKQGTVHKPRIVNYPISLRFKHTKVTVNTLYIFAGSKLLAEVPAFTAFAALLADGKSGK